MSALASYRPPALALVDRDPREVYAAWLGNVSQRTRRAYAADLEDIARWAKLADAPTATTWLVSLGQGILNQALFEYLGDCRRRGLSPGTANRRRAAVRSVLAAGRLMGYTLCTLEVRRQQAESYRDTAGPGPDKLRAMLDDLAAKAAAGNPLALRDRAAVLLMALRGLRKGEVLSLDLEHYDRPGRRLFVLGKQRSGREWLTIPQPCADALDAWLAVLGDRRGALFCGITQSKGIRLSARALNRVLEPYGIRPHGLRHAAITAALELTGGDTTKVQRFSRHKSLAVLAVYDDRRQDLGGQVADLLASQQQQRRTQVPTPTPADLAKLTPRQRELVDLLNGGKTRLEAAKAMGISAARLREILERCMTILPTLRQRWALSGAVRARQWTR